MEGYTDWLLKVAIGQFVVLGAALAWIIWKEKRWRRSQSTKDSRG